MLSEKPILINCRIAETVKEHRAKAVQRNQWLSKTSGAETSGHASPSFGSSPVGTLSTPRYQSTISPGLPETPIYSQRQSFSPPASPNSSFTLPPAPPLQRSLTSPGSRSPQTSVRLPQSSPQTKQPRSPTTHISPSSRASEMSSILAEHGKIDSVEGASGQGKLASG
ncbi:unnamed protein product [Protopolystoma xenopodis]|uniref:Uncharacterized protein n=1 Tax=Protopolystoma xenopodis TaxID=117903 RepID=A0A448WJT8_9PLAT|nr:unnamed protein product [Protopolystoma xenopodis]